MDTFPARTYAQPMTDGLDAERDAFVDSMTAAALGSFDILSIRLGDRLGLYRALAEGGLERRGARRPRPPR
jgi:hypothetical protein